MPLVVKQCPLKETRQQIKFNDSQSQSRFFDLKSRELLVWISVTRLSSPIPGRPFPAIIDTGTTAALLIHESQLRLWGDVQPALMLPRASERLIRINQQHLAVRYQAQIWLHPTTDGSWRRQSPQHAIRLNPPHGIAVVSLQRQTTTEQAVDSPTRDEFQKINFPCKPLLGLAAFITQPFYLTIRPDESFDLFLTAR